MLAIYSNSSAISQGRLLLFVFFLGIIGCQSDKTSSRDILDWKAEHAEREVDLREAKRLYQKLMVTPTPVEYRPLIYVRQSSSLSASPEAFAKSVRHLCDELSNFEPFKNDYLPLLVMYTKQIDIDPYQRKILLDEIGHALNRRGFEQSRQLFRDILLTELIRIALEGRSVESLEGNLVELKKGFDAAPKTFNVPSDFRVYADALMDTEASEQLRFEMFYLICDIAALCPPSDHDLRDVLFGPNTPVKSGYLYNIKPFSQVYLVSSQDRPSSFATDNIYAYVGSILTKSDILALERRINSLEGKVSKLEQDVKSIRLWQQNVDDWRDWIKTKIEQHDVQLKSLFGSRPIPKSGDMDADGISDTFERALIDRFAPVIYPSEEWKTPLDEHGPPVSVSWLLSHSFRAVKWAEDVPNRNMLSLDEALSDLGVEHPGAFPRKAGTIGWKINNRTKWGDGLVNWDNAAERNDGIYAHVWRPWPDSPQIYSVQYYVFFTYNNTAFSGGMGNHEGDWLGIDLGVEVAGEDPRNSKIVHAIYHNHGRQLFLKPQVLEFEGTHPKIYPERSSNEAWPRAGNRNSNPFPNSDGFATNVHFDLKDATNNGALNLLIDTYSLISGEDQSSEYKVCREHDGRGKPWRTWASPIPNLGETDGKTYFYLAEEHGDKARECLFILAYPGLWGEEEETAENPQGPPYQSKMWARQFPGPWSVTEGPTDPKLGPVQALPGGQIRFQTMSVRRGDELIELKLYLAAGKSF